MDNLFIALWNNIFTRIPIIFGLIATIICATTPFDFLIIAAQWFYLGYYVLFVLLSGNKGELEVNLAGLFIHVIFCFICYHIPDLI